MMFSFCSAKRIQIYNYCNVFRAIRKDQFKEMKNNHLEQEPFVVCTGCGRKQHQICVLHHEQIWPQGFCCDNCLKKKGAKRKDNKFSAKKLPASKLGIFIETRVNNYLKKKETGAGEVHIRVVASSDKVIIFIFSLNVYCNCMALRLIWEKEN